MSPLFAAMIALLALAPPENAASRQNGCSVGELTCEYLVNPLGIDTEKPRLSWVLSPGLRGQRQTAYRVAGGQQLRSPSKRPGRSLGLGKSRL